MCFCSSQLHEAADPDPTNLLLPPTPCLSAMTAVGRCCVLLASDQRCPRQAEPAGLLGGGWLGRTDGRLHDLKLRLPRETWRGSEVISRPLGQA